MTDDIATLIERLHDPYHSRDEAYKAAAVLRALAQENERLRAEATNSDEIDDIRQDELDCLAQENERLNSEEPGTPLGRLAGIARFAQERGLCTGAEAKPAELFVIERIRELEDENERRRANEAGLAGAIHRRTDRIRELEAQLPEGMEHCTIRFKECEKGHGRLIADNWVDSGCPWCEINRLQAISY